MAEEDKKKVDGEMVQVPSKLLTEIQESLAKQELEMEEMRNKNAGLEELLSKAGTDGEVKLREKKNFEPKFRTVRVRKYPIAGDYEKMGYVIGFTNRGAYEEVDRTGISPQIVNYIDVIFLGHEKNDKGVLQAEKIKLLDFLNKGIQVHCKIVDEKKEKHDVPTGEEINVHVFDPQHGLVSNGEIIDGYTSYTEISYKIQIPSIAEPIWIDAMYCNL